MEIEYKRDEWKPAIENSVGRVLEVEVSHAGVLQEGQLEQREAELERLTEITGRLLDLLTDNGILSAEEALAIITNNEGELISAVKEPE